MAESVAGDVNSESTPIHSVICPFAFRLCCGATLPQLRRNLANASRVRQVTRAGINGAR
jgi:hypothetical protein